MREDKLKHGDLKPLEILLPNVSRETLESLFQYAALVVEWSHHLNLTGANSLEKFIINHVIDCCNAYRYAPNFNSIIDVGSGAGLPGIVWAIIDPNKKYILIEASEKKTSFLYRVISLLKLGHVRVIRARLENLTGPIISELNKTEFHFVSRGTTSPEKLLRLAKKTTLKWCTWTVFSSEKTNRDFLTLSTHFGMEVGTVHYPKYAENITNLSGILTILKKI